MIIPQTDYTRGVQIFFQTIEIITATIKTITATKVPAPQAGVVVPLVWDLMLGSTLNRSCSVATLS